MSHGFSDTKSGKISKFSSKRALSVMNGSLYLFLKPDKSVVANTRVYSFSMHVACFYKGDQIMRRLKEQRIARASRLAFIGGVVILIGMSSVAQAGPGNRHHQHTSTCGCDVGYNAGRIWIDGKSTRIRSDRSRNKQIASAFRRAGYDAWISHGRVRVDYGYCKPSVRWDRDAYNARFRWDHGQFSISLFKPTYSYGRDRHLGYSSHRRYPVARRSLRRSWCD
jgi:hypothetical protein